MSDLTFRQNFENASETERPTEPNSESEKPEQWALLLDYEEAYSDYLEMKLKEYIKHS